MAAGVGVDIVCVVASETVRDGQLRAGSHSGYQNVDVLTNCNVYKW